jgi:hypothetical protein
MQEWIVVHVLNCPTDSGWQSPENDLQSARRPRELPIHITAGEVV